MTQEGIFVNLTSRENCDESIKQFVTNFDVYPSEKIPLITELFQII